MINELDDRMLALNELVQEMNVSDRPDSPELA